MPATKSQHNNISFYFFFSPLVIVNIVQLQPSESTVICLVLLQSHSSSLVVVVGIWMCPVVVPVKIMNWLQNKSRNHSHTSTFIISCHRSCHRSCHATTICRYHTWKVGEEKVYYSQPRLAASSIHSFLGVNLGVTPVTARPHSIIKNSNIIMWFTVSHTIQDTTLSSGSTIIVRAVKRVADAAFAVATNTIYTSRII